jgi:uncharacterized membrane protein
MASWTDQRVESVIGNLLRAGVVASAALVLAGGVIYLARHGAAHPGGSVFQGEPAALRSPGGILSAARLDSRGIIQLGLLLLIATPVARVAFSVFAFLRQRDYLYVAVTLIVLGLLLYSVAAGGL